MNEKIIVEGIVESIIFQNQTNDYCVFTMTPIIYDNEDETDDEKNITEQEHITCIGNVSGLNEGENIKLTGKIVSHSTYGEQLKIEQYEKIIPKTKKAIEKYLASGLISGIRERLANKIVAKFGTNTLNIIENEPRKLASIKGISLKKALAIHEIFHEQKSIREVMFFLQNHGVSTSAASKIYQKFKDETINIVSKNPYCLADEIFGIGFKTADLIAEKIGVFKDSFFRIKAGTKFVLTQEANNGNVYFPYNQLITKCSALLEIPPELIENAMIELNLKNDIWIEKINDDNIKVYLNYYYYTECYVAKKLIELSLTKIESNFNYNDDIRKIESKNNIKFALHQKEAIKQAMTNGVLVITGGPGTGKTTTINAIIELLQNEGNEILLAAPTGRAAKRMTETTGIEAQTIHRLLGIGFNENNKQLLNRNDDDLLETDVIIIDETSMVDILLMNALLKAIAHGTRLILVGDVDQLPSVGAGNVLKDIISSKCIKVVRLNEIFRQAQESAIIMNAHRINRGEYPILNEKNKDFFFVKRYNIDELVKTIIELVTKRLPNYMSCDSLKDIQVLTPMRKTLVGVNNLNTVLQNILNPADINKPEILYGDTIFRYGDKVMQIKNNYNTPWILYENNIHKDEGVGVFNGDEGFITNVNNSDRYIEVTFDENKVVKYDYTQLSELELSYAVTIHKSQGSEYKVVVIPIFSGPYMLMNRNLIYTAITRAKELAVIAGIPETLYKMVDNNNEINRYTSLKSRIINNYKFMTE